MDLLTRAVAHHRDGRADQAEALYRLCLAANPGEPNALTMLAAIERSRGMHAPARDKLMRAVQEAPQRLDIWEALGDAHRILGDQSAALAAYDTAVALNPARADGWRRKADLLLAIDATDQALDWLEQACTACIGDSALWDLNGCTSHGAGRFRRAAMAFASALRLAPHRSDLMIKHAAICLELGRMEQAIAGFEASRASEDSSAEVATERGLAKLAAGQLAEGWQDYAARWSVRGAPPPAALANRAWDGTTRAGMRLLVCAEQGIGDQIMFGAGFPALVRALGPDGKLTIECAPKLASLFARAWPQASIEPTRGETSKGMILSSYDWIAAYEPLDAVAFMADLHRYLLPEIDGSAYLTADKAKAAHWRRWLAQLGPGPKIGVNWRSSMARPERDSRSPPIEAWHRVLAAFPQAQFVNLQYDDPDGSSWSPACTASSTTVHTPPGLDQFDDLDSVAALMEGLDLVISTPTAVAALSAALARPTLRVLRGCDWTLYGQGRSPFTDADTVLLPREWYGPSAISPIIAAARNLLDQR